MHKSENSLRRQIKFIFDCFTAVRLKKTIHKTQGSIFSSNKSAFIGKHESKDRQRPNWKGNSSNSTVSLHYTVTGQPNDTLLYLIGWAWHVKRLFTVGSFGFDK